MEKAMTKIEILALIRELCSDNEIVVSYCDKETASLEAKAAKAKARAAEKKAAGDELYATVVECVGSEPVTAETVLGMIEGEDLTPAKIRARLSQAVKNGVLTKETLKVDGKNKVHYARA